jgi:hypothetical protein
MRIFAVVSISLLLAISCGSKKKVPRGILDTEKMEAVMWDIMQVDQFLSDFVFNKDTSLNRLNEHTKRYEQVFAMHGTDRAEFTRSFKYYNENPKLFKVVMDSLNTKPLMGDENVPPIKVDDSVGKRKRFTPPKIPTESQK